MEGLSSEELQESAFRFFTTSELALPSVSFGSDEGVPSAEGVFLRSNSHPRAYGNVARLRRRYVRDEKVLPLAEAVRKLTSLPAENLKLDHRGRLAPAITPTWWSSTPRRSPTTPPTRSPPVRDRRPPGLGQRHPGAQRRRADRRRRRASGARAWPDGVEEVRREARRLTLAYTGFMTKAELQSEALRLPVDERMDLAEALWESLDDESVRPALPEWQRQILDERITADDAAPDAGSPWNKVKRRILASL